MSALRPKPWWLRLTTPRDFFITLHPWIYYPGPTPPAETDPILAHERAHLEQEASGLARYLWRYWTRRAFRLQAEAEAMAAELAAMRSQGYTSSAVKDRRAQCALQLSSSTYLWAAQSPLEAEEAILAIGTVIG